MTFNPETLLEAEAASIELLKQIDGLKREIQRHSDAAGDLASTREDLKRVADAAAALAVRAKEVVDASLKIGTPELMAQIDQVRKEVAERVSGGAKETGTQIEKLSTQVASQVERSVGSAQHALAESQRLAGEQAADASRQLEAISGSLKEEVQRQLSTSGAAQAAALEGAQRTLGRRITYLTLLQGGVLLVLLAVLAALLWPHLPWAPA